MASLPTIAELTTPPSTHGLMRGYLSQLRSYLSGVLGDDGTIATALLTLGALAGSYVAKTAAYTVQIADRGRVIDASGTWTLSLPTVASAGAGFSLVVCNSGSGTITLDGSGAETVDGAATVTLLAGRSALLICSGTAWATLALTGTAGGATLAIAGTSGAPGIAFAADPDTGLKNPAANQIGFVAGGVQRALMTTSALQLDLPLTGTAVMSSLTDATAGRMMPVGAFGLGALAVSDVDANDAGLPTRFLRFSGANSPIPATTWNGLHISRLQDANGTQIAIRDTSASAAPLMAVRHRDSTGAWAAWNVLFGRLNAVGTVSQASGVPTGALIERGSNANGEYLRLADGTQICWLDSIYDASLAAGAYAEVSWTFPIAFVTGSQPTVKVNKRSLSSAAGREDAARYLSAVGGRNGSGLAEAGVVNTKGSAVTARLDVMAMGRWF